MTWSAALLALIISHVVGDVLVQSDWQAINKVRGLSDPTARRALVLHVTTYTLTFAPALIWIGAKTTVWRAVGVGALVAIPHVVIDDGHIVRFWLRDVKRTPDPPLALVIAVDQSFHLLCLFGAALFAAG
jgi:Protein of unknown function (DUF3307)